MENIIKDIIVKEAFKYDSEGKFILSSGKTSFFYINMKKVYLNPQYNNWLGILLKNKITIESTTMGIGGMEIGAIPLAYAVSSAVYIQNHSHHPNVFIVRKKAKEHGTKQRVEHTLDKGTSVIILEDVVSTGSSVIQAIQAVQDVGLIVEQVIAVVDRNEGGSEAITKYVEDYTFLYTKERLFNRYKKLKGI